MMDVLLDLAEFREEHGIRPHSLKVTTIAAVMGEIVKGKSNLAQLAARGNYRAATAQDMGKGLLAKFGTTEDFRLEICTEII